MGIGTWNLKGKWGDGHRDLLLGHDVVVWLLTEVSPKVAKAVKAKNLECYDQVHLTEDVMPDNKKKQHWAGILSRSREPLKALADPHGASAAAVIGDTTYCSSVLPWKNKSCTGWPWIQGSLAEKTAETLRVLREWFPESALVWGGDWNNALTGTKCGASEEGREYLLDAIKELRLKVPTADLPHRDEGFYSIDHIAVPSTWVVQGAWRVVVDPKVSDHDAYIVEASPTSV
jgi:hypothetical protein